MGSVFHLLNALRLLIVADAVFSWIMGPDEFPRSLTKTILDPAYEPLRAVFAGSRADLSPLVALGLLWVVQIVLQKQGHREPR